MGLPDTHPSMRLRHPPTAKAPGRSLARRGFRDTSRMVVGTTFSEEHLHCGNARTSRTEMFRLRNARVCKTHRECDYAGRGAATVECEGRIRWSADQTIPSGYPILGSYPNSVIDDKRLRGNKLRPGVLSGRSPKAKDLA